MNRNVKIAKELVKLAKSLMAEEDGSVHPKTGKLTIGFDNVFNCYALYVKITGVNSTPSELTQVVSACEQSIGEAWMKIARLFPETLTSVAPTKMRVEGMDEIMVIRPIRWLRGSAGDLKAVLNAENVSEEEFRKVLSSNSIDDQTGI